MRYQLSLLLLLPLVYGSPIAQRDDALAQRDDSHEDQTIAVNVDAPAPTVGLRWEAAIGLEQRAKTTRKKTTAKKTTTKKTTTAKTTTAKTTATTKASTTKKSATTTKASTTKRSATTTKASSTKKSATLTKASSTPKITTTKGPSSKVTTTSKNVSSKSSTPKVTSTSKNVSSKSSTSKVTSTSKSVSSKSPSTSKASSSSSRASSSSASASASASACPIKKTTTSTTANKSGVVRRWLSWLTPRVGENYGTLDMPSGTGVTALTAWVKDKVYKGNVKQVVVQKKNTATVEDLKATAIFEDFKDTPFYMSTKGLYGCTSLVVTSHCGAYMAHFWESSIKDEVYTSDHVTGKNVYLAAVQYPLQNDMKQSKAKAALVNKQLKQYGSSQELTPTTNWVSLQAHANCLNAANGVKVAVFPSGNKDGSAGKLYPQSSAGIAKVAADIVGISESAVKILPYRYTNEGDSEDTSNGHGKVLLTYNPKTGAENDHAYQVYAAMSPESVPILAYGDTWKGTQTCDCKAEPEASCCCVM